MTKRILILFMAVVAAASFASAKKMSDLKIYINPGHGGYTSNDRPIRIYPFAANDTLGYWESKSNLYKGLHMYHILDSLGAKPYLSRTKNTENDDRSLSGISAEANALGVDLFFSIHSNAGENVNYPLMLYRENTIGTPRYAGNVELSKILWKNLHSNRLPYWTRDKEYVEGDLTFYQNMWQGGLGVLRQLYVVGLLSEGGMHEHRPEAHRLMNDDYLWLEAWHFVKSIMEYCNTTDRFVTGNVAGVVYDNHNLREKDIPTALCNFTMYGRDKLAPLNKASVTLADASGKVVQTRTTDDMHNGIFVFRNVKPGTYTVTASRNDYYTETTQVTVVANEVTYTEAPMTLRREFPLEITAYGPNHDQSNPQADPVSCSSAIEFTFNTDVDTESFEKAFSITPEVAGYWEYSETYHKARYVPEVSLERNTLYTVRVENTASTPDKYYDKAAMVKPLEFKFQTRDRDRLEVIDQFPRHQGEMHYTSPVIEFRFDSQVNASNIYDCFTVTDASGNALSMNKRTTKYNQLSNKYGNIVFALMSSLKPGEKYHACLTTDLRDREALPIPENVEFDFVATDVVDEAPEQTIVLDFENDAPFVYDADNTVGIGTVLPTAQRSTAVKLVGNASARFGYKFNDIRNGEVVWNYTGEPIQFNTNDIIGMYVNGDFNNHEVWVGLTSGTNKKYTKLTDLDFLGWQYRQAKLENLEADFCPFLLSDIKLVQRQSPITQQGYFALDNVGRIADTGGVCDITADNGAIVSVADGTIVVDNNGNDAVTVAAIDGRLIGSGKGNVSFGVAPGLYIVCVNGQSVKVIVK